MRGMISGAKVFNQDIGKWDVTKVTSMYGMFSGAKVFNENIGEWDVSAVTETSSMFTDAWAFNQDISKWDVTEVSGPLVEGQLWGMNSMFSGAKAFNQNLATWCERDGLAKTDMFTGSACAVSSCGLNGNDEPACVTP